MRCSHYIGSLYRLMGKIVPAADLRCQEKNGLLWQKLSR
jgi:hypothetical protein